MNETLNLPAGSVFEFTVTGTVAAGAPSTLNDTVTIADPAGTTDPESATAGTVNNNTSTVSAAVSGVASASVVDRTLFYPHSFFDGNNTGVPTTADFNAIATDKVPLMPGQTATFDNVSGFADGIDGIFIDISGVPVPANITAADFEFTVGNSSTPGTGSSPGTGWAALGTAPTVTLFAGLGVGGSDRFALTWPAGTISGNWLQVTIRGNTGTNPDTNTGLATPDVFYFGSAPGETGNSTTDFRVNATDEIDARNDPHNFSNRASIADPNDFNRDSFVNGNDESVARSHSTTFLSALKVISVPGLPNGQTSGTGILSVSSIQAASNGVASSALRRAVITPLISVVADPIPCPRQTRIPRRSTAMSLTARNRKLLPGGPWRPKRRHPCRGSIPRPARKNSTPHFAGSALSLRTNWYHVYGVRAHQMPRFKLASGITRPADWPGGGAGLSAGLLAASPDNPEVLHLLGVLAGQAGQSADAAVEFIWRAIRLSPVHGPISRQPGEDPRRRRKVRRSGQVLCRGDRAGARKS